MGIGDLILPETGCSVGIGDLLSLILPETGCSAGIGDLLSLILPEGCGGDGVLSGYRGSSLPYPP